MNYIEKLLQNKGFKTEYKSKCLIMSIKDKYNLGFLGHTDTVMAGSDWGINPYEMKEDKEKLYGLGICDMKGGIAGILQAIIETDWEKLKYGMKLYFTYDEEINFLGIKEIKERKEKFPKNMIIGEPSNNIIMNSSKGLLEFKIAFTGISAHSSMINKGENAIEKSIEFLNELKSFYNELKKDKNDNSHLFPTCCEVFIDFRLIKSEHKKLILNKISELTRKYNATYTIINSISPFANKNEKMNPTT